MKVLLLAGEPSGDRWAARLAAALRALDSTVEVRAMGGSACAGAGVPLVVDSTSLAVVGLVEVLGSLPRLAAALRELKRCVAEWKPDVIVPVDYPDFNLRLATWARARGVPVAWFIAPQVWAWRPNRVAQYARAVSRMLVIFPFEAETWRRAGVPVEHVGHPLLDCPEAFPSREAARETLGLDPDATVVALLPGSRRREVQHVWPTLADAARAVFHRTRGVRFLLPIAPGLDRVLFERLTKSEDFRLRYVPAGASLVLGACDVAAVASGTATLETALAGRPLVVGYRVSPLTMSLSRRLAEPGFLARGLFSLPNLVLGRAIVRELYQDAFTSQAVADELLRLLGDAAARREQVEALAPLRDALGGPGCFRRAALAIAATVSSS